MNDMNPWIPLLNFLPIILLYFTFAVAAAWIGCTIALRMEDRRRGR
jgi:hypothetical protein